MTFLAKGWRYLAVDLWLANCFFSSHRAYNIALSPG